MTELRVVLERRRAREFEAFAAGAAGRLLHAAVLLTTEPRDACPAAERLLTRALARTYAAWDALRGEDPYDRTRAELTALFARTAWRYRRSRGGVLGRLTPQERLVLVLRVREEVAEERTAAGLGLPEERVRAILARAVARMRHPAAGPGPASGPAARLGMAAR
ncbi:sigma factor-like helix-turn-helix DNA-binding protein [Streptomyces sp. TRM70308]|uniref:sigma factor-like helix-turn-helix DNA-binding protein n=1 Tax=Streptomyces sp. TRM70308 TaxID=3131932 RepID=UPI003D06E177